MSRSRIVLWTLAVGAAFIAGYLFHGGPSVGPVVPSAVGEANAVQTDGRDISFWTCSFSFHDVFPLMLHLDKRDWNKGYLSIVSNPGCSSPLLLL